MEVQSSAPPFIKAIRLFNTNKTDCAFEYGGLPTKLRIDVGYFFAQNEVDLYEKTAHPAPRRQYVITIKGKLKFTVTNGDYFFVEPGIILIAEDLDGPGHTWELLDGQEWERIYIPMEPGAETSFIADPS